jgi:four helix bundle protein
MSKYGFKELIVWQKSKALAVEVYKLTGAGRITRDFSLVDQMRRSAVSVPSNIAEGDERGSDRESIRFFYISKGSLAELITQLEIAKDVGHLTANDVEPLSERCAEIGRLLGGLIKARSRFGPKVLMLFAGVAVGAAFAVALL